MQHLNELESRFENLYPDFSAEFFPVPGTTMAEDMQTRLRTTRDMIQGSLKTSAQVLEQMPANEAQLQALMENSQGAVGILQATQAGNQMAGNIAGQLMSLNAQLATYIQAHTAHLMEVNGAALAAKNRLYHVLDEWGTPYTPNPIPENPF